MTRSPNYRLRRQGSGRTRLDGTPTGQGHWIVAMPDRVVAIACNHAGCEPERLRFQIGWDPTRQVVIYLPTREPPREP